MLTTDTLGFNTETEIATFFGPTKIVSDENTIYCESGWYNTKSDFAFFHINVRLENPPQVITADTIHYDRNSGIGKAFRNITMLDTVKNTIINSHKATYYEHMKSMIATDQAIMTHITDNDSMYISADTLKSLEDGAGLQSLFAHHNVRIFRNNLQGVCDSLVYSDADSLLRMFHNPVLWNDSTQFSADTIILVMENKTLKRMHLLQNAFIAMMHDAQNFDQVKGNTITGFVEEDTLRSMLAEGNVESIYFIREDDGSYTGVNKVTSNRMRFLMDDGEIDRIISYSPEGSVQPLRNSNPESLHMTGLYWQEYRRPNSRQSLLTEPIPYKTPAGRSPENKKGEKEESDMVEDNFQKQKPATAPESKPYPEERPTRPSRGPR